MLGSVCISVRHSTILKLSVRGLEIMSGEYVKILGAERIKMEWIAPKSKRGESQRTEKGTVAGAGGRGAA